MKCLALAAAAALVLIAIPGVASAQASDAILRRLEALEQELGAVHKENATLRARVRRLEGRDVAAAPSGPYAAAAPVVTKAAVVAMPARPRRDDWSGVHVGLFSGYALGGHWTGDAPDYPHQAVNGWFGGGLVGYDRQLGDWLVGVEADLAAADIKQTDNYVDAALTLKLDALATLRARLGYAWDRNLVYLTGGAAVGHLSLTANQYHPGGPGSNPFQTQADHVHVGYAAGAGWQRAIVDDVSVKAEYLWIDLPQATYVLPEPAGFTGQNAFRTGWNSHTFKLGVNWLLQ